MVVYYTARIVIPIHLLAYCIVEASAYLFSFDVYWSGLSVFLSIILTPLATAKAYSRYRPKTKIRDSMSKITLVLDNLFRGLFVLGILPVYFSLSPGMKIVVLILAHFFPFNIINAANRIRAIRASESQYMAFRYMILTNQKSKGLMAFSRRIMLLNVGDSDTTMWAIAICAVSDLILRCFLVDIDTWLLKKLDRANIENKNSARAKIRQTAWACELNLLSTMEITAIISATIFFIILKPQMVALDIGYSITEDISTSILFANLLLQLFAETVVTIISGWWNKQRGVPVMTFFSMISSNTMILFLAFYGVGNILLVLYGLVRHATIFACASPNDCDCLHVESIKAVYEIPCAGGRFYSAKCYDVPR